MPSYIKTPLGVSAVKERNTHLSARQRRLLILIGTADFELMNKHLKERLAEPQLVDQLLQMKLIKATSGASASSVNLIAAKKMHASTLVDRTKYLQAKQPKDFLQMVEQFAEPARDTTKKEQLVKLLDLDGIKQLMISSLQEYCGLMARLLIDNITETKDQQRLKACLMQWLTLLQETRINSAILSEYRETLLQSINALSCKNNDALIVND